MSDLGAVDDVSAQRRAKFAAKTEAFIKTVTDPQGRGLSHCCMRKITGQLYMAS